jgi:glycerol-3-phosphate dehydrogenase
MGGTDIRYKEESYVEPNQADLKFLIHEIDFYTNRNTFVNKNDIFSVWTGIRPLIKDDSKEFTEEIVRRHSILIDKDGLITCTGGKWTIYRLMAEQAINKLVRTFKLKTKRGCVTRHIKLLGAQNYSEETINDIKTHLRISYDVAEHLATSYGTRALLISNYTKERPSSFVSEYPHIKEEILYQMDHEMAFKITDVLFNRLMLSYIDVRTAFDLVEIVGEIMKEHYNWSEDYYKEQCEEAKVFLNTAGYSLLNTTEIDL